MSPRRRTAVDIARRAEHIADVLHAERELRRVRRRYGPTA